MTVRTKKRSIFRKTIEVKLHRFPKFSCFKLPVPSLYLKYFKLKLHLSCEIEKFLKLLFCNQGWEIIGLKNGMITSFTFHGRPIKTRVWKSQS